MSQRLRSVSYRDDADLTAGTAFNMTATSIARSGAGTVNFSGVESVAVTSGGSAQTFDISGTAAATTITTLSFFGRPAGNATFTCGPTLSTFVAPLSFDVAVNTLNNALVINDLGSGNDTYTISNSAISRGTFSVAFVVMNALIPATSVLSVVISLGVRTPSALPGTSAQLKSNGP